MPPEPPEKPGNQTTYPQRGSFAVLLGWHLDFGTRPSGSADRPGKRWDPKEFAGRVLPETNPESGSRSVRNWRSGRSRPQHIGSIEAALFGDNAAFKQWRADLRAAYDGNQQPMPSSPIPRPPEHFLGRTKDVKAILKVLLAGPRPVAITIQGGPGIGKTSLTQAIGGHRDVVARFGERNRWFVPLDAANSAEAMRDAVTRAVGGDPTAGFEATLALLRRQPGLMILDNLETPWDPKSQRQLIQISVPAA